MPPNRVKFKNPGASPSRSQQFAQAAPQSGMTAVGIIGWIVAVCAIVLLVAVAMMGSRRTAAARAANAAVLADIAAEAKARVQALENQKTELDTKLGDLRREETDLVREIGQLRMSERKLTREADTLSSIVTSYESQFAMARSQLGFQYQTLDDLLAAHAAALKKAATAPAPGAGSSTAVTIRAPIPAATTNPAWVVRAPDEPAAPAGNVTVTVAPDPAAAPGEGEKTEVIKPDPKFLRVECETTKKRSGGKNTDYYTIERSTELVNLSVKVKNGHFRDDYNGLIIYVLIVGQSVNDGATFLVMDKIQKTFDAKSRQEVEAYSGEIQNRYYDSKQYKSGYKYDGYLVVVCDQEGTPLADNAVRTSLSKYRDKIIKYDRGSHFNAKGDPVTNVRNFYY